MSGPWTLAVDFGTTSTVTAMGSADGSSEILEVDGDRKMPSLVVVDEDHTVVVGIAAAGLARSMPQRTIRTPKNRVGDAVPIVVGGVPYQPVAFATAVLEHVLADATRFQGSPPTHSRLTYPATWNRPKRARLLEAAAKAGYPDPELVAEPIAAALTYVDYKTLDVGNHVAVFDLGGGTFDTVVLLRTADGFSVVGHPVGDPQLGGELFDEILMNYVGEQIDQALWDELLVSEETDWMRAAARLRSECRRAKEALSSHPVAEVSVGLPGGLVDVSITRAELDELIIPFIDESIDLLERCITDANLTGETIDAIYVTGGASRMPVVEHRVREAYPHTEVSRRGDPKIAVALGALLAVPGSFDESLQQSPDRTTLEDDSTNTPASPPRPPTIAVPQGPETHVHDPAPPASAAPTPAPPALAVPSVVPLAPQPESEPVQLDAGTHFSDPLAVRVSNAAVPNVAVPPSGAAPDAVVPGRVTQPTDASISVKIMMASLVTVLLIAGGIGAFLVLRDDGTTTTQETGDVEESSTTTLPPSEEISEDSVVGEPDEEIAKPGLITEQAFRNAAISTDDLGFEWLTHPDGIDMVNRNLCNVEQPVPGLMSEMATFQTRRVKNSLQLTTQIQLFVDGQGAQQQVDFADSLATLCPSPTSQFTVDEILVGTVIPLEANDNGETRSLVIPEAVDSSTSLAYGQSVEDRENLDPHVLSVDIRVDRMVGTVVLFTPGSPNLVDIDFINSVLETMTEKLEEIQQ